MELLLVINAQNSFLDPQGSVYLGAMADTLKIRLRDCVGSFIGKKVFCKEIHALGDEFFLGEKTHSIATTPDTKLCDDLKPFGDIIEKSRYTAFYNTTLESMLMKERPSRVTVVGLETHTSVLFTVEDLRNRGYNVRVIEPCTYSRNDYLHNYAISLMRNYLGVHIE